MPLFDLLLIVDWSANSKPKLGADSIWIAGAGPAATVPPLNLPTRAAALAHLRAMLADAVAARRRVLVGFDFPFGYPAGLAGVLGLSGPPWRAVWDEIADAIEDAPDNANNRFAVAADLNRRISGGAAPFWGRPITLTTLPDLPMRKPAAEASPLAEHRTADTWVRGPQPVWKLYTTGSVGSQALMGLPVVRALRDDPALSGHARVWPFETGLGPPSTAPGRPCIVLAEVYPSLFPIAARADEVKDATQVRTTATALAAMDADDALAPLFAGPPALTATQRGAIESEEAWILGLM